MVRYEQCAGQALSRVYLRKQLSGIFNGRRFNEVCACSLDASRDSISLRIPSSPAQAASRSAGAARARVPARHAAGSRSSANVLESCCASLLNRRFPFSSGSLRARAGNLPVKPTAVVHSRFGGRRYADGLGGLVDIETTEIPTRRSGSFVDQIRRECSKRHRALPYWLLSHQPTSLPGPTKPCIVSLASLACSLARALVFAASPGHGKVRDLECASTCNQPI